LQPTTSRLLNDSGLAAGMRCLDVGCGGGHVTLHLARQVGAHGKVVGSDIDAEILALARADAEAAGLGNVEFRVVDVQNDPGASEQDLVYARFILSHLRDPAACAAAIAGATRGGGVLVVEDVDFGGSFCHPHCPAHQRYLELYRQVVRQRGGDPDIGPRLPGLLREAGLRDIRIGLVQPVHIEGDGKYIASITMRRIADAVVAEHLAGTDEVEVVVAGLETAARDPGYVIGMPRIFQCSGRRP
jgi:SAM-dependent methyltransferase